MCRVDEDCSAAMNEADGGGANRAVESLHGHAFWFYGVIVALAIEEAAEPVIRHLLSGTPAPVGMESARLGVFLLVSVRLLLGAAVHFDEVRQVDRPGSYRLDLLTGFVHFLILFAWAFTVPVDSSSAWMSPYLLLLFVVIGYDLFWLLICWGNTTARVRGWTFVNALTLGLGLLFFFMAKALGWGARAEHYPVIGIVAFISILDLAEITSGSRHIIPRIASWAGIRVPPTVD